MNNPAAPSADRLEILRLGDAHAEQASERADNSQFAEDVRRGLTASAKHLPPKYFYDELGSRLFDAICLTPEYYLTRAEDEILTRYTDEIISRVAAREEQSDIAPLRLLEMGSGSSAKTRRVIAAILRCQTNLHYYPVDISASALEEAARVLLQSYPTLRVTAYSADYQTALRVLSAKDFAAHTEPRRRTLALFLGSNIGNFSPAAAIEFLRELRGVLRTGDALLIGADLRKDTSTLEAAYDDALGITAAFNLNLLVRINRELAADFQLDGFRHVALYNEAEGRVEMHIESVRAQVVRLAALGVAISFAAGERIHTESSHKYTIADLDSLAAEAGFERAHTWYDDGQRFSSNLFRVA